MHDIANQLMRSTNAHARVTKVYQHRTRHATEAYASRVKKVWGEQLSQAARGGSDGRPPWPWEIAAGWQAYAVDFWQRGILFWDALRQRGKQFVSHELAGKPPVLHFDYEIVEDARRFERPVNYALVRITPPEGVIVDPKRRPYVIIDPRAGHGPGIGGFKDDSQVGVALREGHPVYFVIFYPEPEPGQTMIDVCVAEQAFVRKVHELHPDSPKPVVVGNCQGGWAAMMVAASSPEDTGAIVINGAPMSYWSGAWTEGAGNNPMRYAGGLLGGTWLASLSADLGNGLFDGAYLVQNFESLDPANTFWDKYYHVFANADTEPPRFLEFERWWSGYYLMNREEIEWITKNLFVGNRLWDGETKANGVALDLRSIRSPIVMFASLGDNITPPQQAFNWVADVYASTEELKAGGQVIVGLLHQTAGHLALFVSGKVAKREHTQLVSVLKSIEALPPGLYGMRINETKGPGGKPEYEVDFVEHSIEDIKAKLNRFERVDEKAFQAVGAISDLNQRAYELFAQPVTTALASETSARLARTLNPLRVERWALSDLNPWLSFLDYAADSVKQHRQALDRSHPWRTAEKALSDTISATLDLYRDLRDATSELAFFEIYGSLFSFYLADRPDKQPQHRASERSPRESAVVKAALDGLETGGYPAALARVAELLAGRGTPIPLARIERKAEMVKEYAELLPDLPAHEWKLVRAQQGIIVRFEPEQALATLPRLLADPVDRERFMSVVERIVNDREFAAQPSAEQLEMAKRIRKVLGKKTALRRTPDEATA
jgi:pimeloyl-ACP methyl ester carboxylesterase